MGIGEYTVLEVNVNGVIDVWNFYKKHPVFFVDYFKILLCCVAIFIYYIKLTSILNAIVDIKEGTADKYAILHDLHTALLECLICFMN